MGRGTLVAVAMLPLLLLALEGGVEAGEYHYGDRLYCFECHTMHYSQQHRLDGTAFPGSPPWSEAPLAPGGPFAFLLRADGVNELCLTCHDGQTFAPDVLGAHSGSHVRQAGALATGATPYEGWKGHELGYSGPVPGHANPGQSCMNCHFVNGQLVVPISCISCHMPHGDEGYRNIPNISYALGTNDTTQDVFVRGFTLGDVSGNYGADNIDLNEPDAQQSAIGQFCRGCHGRFHGQQGDMYVGGAGGTEWIRHPMADADLGSVGSGSHSDVSTFGSHEYRLKVMSPSGDWGPQGAAWPAPAVDLTPTCTTCHRAHGNQNPFGLIMLEGTGPLTEEGDVDGVARGLRSLCDQCHPPPP